MLDWKATSKEKKVAEGRLYRKKIKWFYKYKTLFKDYEKQQQFYVFHVLFKSFFKDLEKLNIALKINNIFISLNILFFSACHFLAVFFSPICVIVVQRCCKNL